MQMITPNQTGVIANEAQKAQSINKKVPAIQAAVGP